MCSTRLMASVASLACTLTFVPAVAADAQRPPAISQRPREKPAASTADAPTKRRFWAQIGIAKGAVSMSCDVCRGERETALAGTVSFGGVARRRMLLGVELDGFRAEREDVVQRLYAVNGVALLYPWARVPIHLKVGAGFLHFGATDGDAHLSTNALSAQVGAGVDVRVNPAYVIVPYATVVNGWRGTLELEGVEMIDKAGVLHMQVGLAIALR